jgi:hypothetical protein
MSPTQSFNTTAIKPEAQQTLQGPDAGAQSNKYEGSNAQLPRAKPSLHRHYSSLQEHAEQLRVEQATADDDDDDDGGASPHPGSRRDGLSWGLKPAYDDESRKHNRNPLPPEQLGRKTPPTLDELMRRPTNEDADTAHNARVSRRHVCDFPLPAESTGSSATYDPPTRRDTRKSSIACFARGLARHIPDMRLANPPGITVEHPELQTKRTWGSGSSVSSTKDIKPDRDPSFVLPTLTRQGASMEKLSRQASGAECSSIRKLSAQSSGKGSLRDRRKVNLDLSLPGNIPKVPTQITHFSGITPSRSRSPKTPHIHSEAANWSQHTVSKTAPILKEFCASPATFGEGREKTGLLPDNDPIVSSYSPKLQHPSKIKPRNRARPSHLQSQRERSGHGEASADAIAQSPDGSHKPDDDKALEVERIYPIVEFEHLNEVSKTARASRWRWARSTTRSSDGASPSPFGEPSIRRTSINPFKRSNRIADQLDKEREPKQSPSPPSRLWWIGKQPPAGGRRKHSTASIVANIPTTPVVVLSGLDRAPTPPVVDASVEVKSKLADFFFDHTADIEGRRPRPSPGGHWDSDTLLMSYLSPDTRLDVSIEEEEGPEGPTSIEYAPRGFTVDHNPGYGTPGFVVAPQSYMDAKPLHTSHSSSRQGSSPEVWFRVPQCVTPEEKPLTPLALREMDERKRFEWIVPEHLPNSPLCPLHPKYTGYNFGKCLWHGQWNGVTDSERNKGHGSGDVGDNPTTGRGRRGWEVGKFDAQPEEVSEVKRRKRRLASLSSP